MTCMLPASARSHFHSFPLEQLWWNHCLEPSPWRRGDLLFSFLTTISKSKTFFSSKDLEAGSGPVPYCPPSPCLPHHPTTTATENNGKDSQVESGGRIPRRTAQGRELLSSMCESLGFTQHQKIELEGMRGGRRAWKVIRILTVP